MKTPLDVKDGGSTTLYTTNTVYTVNSVFTAYTSQTALHCFNSSMIAYKKYC